MCVHVLSLFFFFSYSVDPLNLHSFPTRRSSDLWSQGLLARMIASAGRCWKGRQHRPAGARTHLLTLSHPDTTALDRKSTRLNSSHLGISYAVFCLKKKKTKS